MSRASEGIRATMRSIKSSWKRSKRSWIPIGFCFTVLGEWFTVTCGILRCTCGGYWLCNSLQTGRLMRTYCTCSQAWVWQRLRSDSFAFCGGNAPSRVEEIGAYFECSLLLAFALITNVRGICFHFTLGLLRQWCIAKLNRCDYLLLVITLIFLRDFLRLAGSCCRDFVAN